MEIILKDIQEEKIIISINGINFSNVSTFFKIVYGTEKKVEKEFYVENYIRDREQKQKDTFDVPVLSKNATITIEPQDYVIEVINVNGKPYSS